MRLWLHIQQQGCLSLLRLSSCCPPPIHSFLHPRLRCTGTTVCAAAWWTVLGTWSQWKMTHQKWISSLSDLLQSPTTGCIGTAEVMMWEWDCAAEERRSCWRRSCQRYRQVTSHGSEGRAWLFLQHSHVPSLPESAVFATRSLILFEIKTPKSTFICLQYER